MAKPYRVLLVSASDGTGPFHAAEALKAAFLEEDPRTVVPHVDILTLGPAWLRVTYGAGFGLLASRAPGLWRELYYRTDGGTDAVRWGAPVHRLLFREFRRLATREPWDRVLATHFRRRVAGARATATGIALHRRFRSAPSRALARRFLGLHPGLPVALVMGGGLGIRVVDATRAAAAAAGPGLQMVAVTGASERARSELASLAAENGRVHVLARAERVQDDMAAADVVVTKPGGLTTTEALALGRPLVLSRAIAGQEEGNADEVVRLGGGIHAPTGSDVRAALEPLFGDHELLRRTAAAASALGRLDSAGAIARLALASAQQRNAA